MIHFKACVFVVNVYPREFPSTTFQFFVRCTFSVTQEKRPKFCFPANPLLCQHITSAYPTVINSTFRESIIRRFLQAQQQNHVSLFLSVVFAYVLPTTITVISSRGCLGSVMFHPQKVTICCDLMLAVILTQPCIDVIKLIDKSTNQHISFIYYNTIDILRLVVLIHLVPNYKVFSQPYKWIQLQVYITWIYSDQRRSVLGVEGQKEGMTGLQRDEYIFQEK